jgi:hypothetical protein
MTLNTATFAPMPMASVSTAIKVKPLCLRSIRIPNRKSCHISSSSLCERALWEAGQPAILIIMFGNHNV